MKKYLSIIVGLMLVIGALPVFAANEVTIDPNVEISVSSYTLVVSGTAKVIDSLSVADSNFTVTLSPGATFSVTSADKRKFSYSVGTGITASTHCTGYSYVSFAASSASAAAADVTVTPSTTETCDGVATAATVTGSTSGGGGGGGGNNPNANIFSQTQTTTTTAAPAATTAAPAATTAAPAATQTSSTVTATSAVGAISSSYSFSASLKLGSSGTDITELQNRLTAEGVYSGPVTGYFGSLTQAAVKAYQAKYGIDQLGIVGPATRAKLNASTAAPVSAPATTQEAAAPSTATQEATAPSTASAVTAPDTTQLTPVQIKDMQAQLQALQAQLQLLLQ